MVWSLLLLLSARGFDESVERGFGGGEGGRGG